MENHKPLNREINRKNGQFKPVNDSKKEEFKPPSSANVEKNYTRKQVVEVIEELLERRELLIDAMENEDTYWDGDALLSLIES